MELAYILSQLLAILFMVNSKTYNYNQKLLFQIYNKLIDFKFEINSLDTDIAEQNDIYKKFSTKIEHFNVRNNSTFNEHLISYKHELEWAKDELEVLKNHYKLVDLESRPVKRSFFNNEEDTRAYYEDLKEYYMDKLRKFRQRADQIGFLISIMNHLVYKINQEVLMRCDSNGNDCSHDESCQEENNCCFDASSSSRNPQKQIKYKQCNLMLTDYKFVYSIGVCPIKNFVFGRKQDNMNLIKDLCELSRPYLSNNNSILSHVPVYYEDSIYNNIYCLMCNDKSINFKKIKYLNITLFNEHSSYSIEQETLNLLKKNTIKANLYEKSKEIKTIECYTMNDECPIDYGYQETIELCHNYTQLVRSYDTFYKNKHCAICSGTNIYDLKCANKQDLKQSNLVYLNLDLNAKSLVYKWSLKEFRLIDYSKFNNFLEFYLEFNIFYNNEKYYFMSDCKYLKADLSLAVSEYNTNLDSSLNDLSGFYCQNLFDKSSIISFISYAAKHELYYA